MGIVSGELEIKYKMKDKKGQDESMKSNFQQSNRCLSSGSIKALERKEYLLVILLILF